MGTCMKERIVFPQKFPEGTLSSPGGCTLCPPGAPRFVSPLSAEPRAGQSGVWQANPHPWLLSLIRDPLICSSKDSLFLNFGGGRAGLLDLPFSSEVNHYTHICFLLILLFA